METFSVQLGIGASPENVLSAFWKLEDWPSLARHVSGIEMLYSDSSVQVLTMVVNTRGRIDRFQSVRVLRGECIHFMQPNPPDILNFHSGCWKFLSDTRGTLVEVEHSIETNEEAAARFIKATLLDSEGGTREAIRKVITENSLQTMRALKEKLERPQKGVNCVQS